MDTQLICHLLQMCMHIEIDQMDEEVTAMSRAISTLATHDDVKQLGARLQEAHNL